MRCITMLFLMAFMVSMSAVAQEDRFGGLSVDVETVTLTLLGEARGEGKLGIYAVACVIQQRQLERSLSAKSVCLQRLQFSCWNKTNSSVLKRQVSGTPKEIVVYAIQIARQLVQGVSLDRTVVGNANHYCVSSLNPYWAKGRRPSAKVGNHKFYTL